MKLIRLYRAIRLFLQIVWRVDSSEFRMSIGTAWAVARGIWLEEETKHK